MFNLIVKIETLNFYSYNILALSFSKYLQEERFQKIEDLTAIPLSLPALQEGRLTELTESIKHQALTQNELKKREAVCQRFEKILKGEGLKGVVDINFVRYNKYR